MVQEGEPMSGLKGMYFYDAHGLAKELRNGTFSEQLAVNQMIAAFLLFGLTRGSPVSVEMTINGSAVMAAVYAGVLFVLAVAVLVYGVQKTYLANAEGDGKDYFLRFAALSLPVGVQVVLVFVVLGLVVVLLFASQVGSLGLQGRLLAAFATAALFPLFLIMFFLRMRKYLRISSGADA